MSRKSACDAISIQQVNEIIENTGILIAVTEDERLILAGHLSGHLSEMVRKAPLLPHISTLDVKAVEAAHARFDALLRSLENTSSPPPSLDWQKNESGRASNPWTRWIDRLYWVTDGRDELYNWPAIGKILAIYQVVYGRAASATSEDGPTMRFLGRCLAP